jgi:START domain
MPGPTMTAACLETPRALEALLDGGPDAAAAGGWKMLTDHRESDVNNWVLYSRPSSDRPAIREFLCVGVAPVAAKTMFDVLVDAEYRLKWDTSCALHEDLEVFKPALATQTHTLSYWAVNYPWPLVKRDYVYERITEATSDGGFLLATQAALSNARPETSKCVRVHDSKTAYCLRPSKEGSGKGTHCRFVYSAIDNPRGAIPPAVVSFLTSKTLPSVMNGLYTACKKR